MCGFALLLAATVASRLHHTAHQALYLVAAMKQQQSHIKLLLFVTATDGALCVLAPTMLSVDLGRTNKHVRVLNNRCTLMGAVQGAVQ